jgi:hypothetical protein
MGECKYISNILDLGTRWRWVLASRPGRFTPGERASGTNWIGSWVRQKNLSCPCWGPNLHSCYIFLNKGQIWNNKSMPNAHELNAARVCKIKKSSIHLSFLQFRSIILYNTGRSQWPRGISTNRLRPLRRWDRALQSHSRHGYSVCVYSVFVLLRV